ncbi:hypothetical protein RV00_GL002284 [Enterococcus devriesei]|uniref:Uncharacterized protein n=2 Tax=Enterococcus TaxID=1350 RepID=A0A1L8SVP8_9ENTE|nr:hypothetical protein RV00_GL002284 [Enterococcus devriesei]
MGMKKVVANPVELRDAIRCEKKTISITSGFAKMIEPLIASQTKSTQQAKELPTFVKLALDPQTMNTLFTSYQVEQQDEVKGLELKYVGV